MGPSVQSALEKKWWISRNYVTDWWETYVYLKPRDSIMINSNYFGLSAKQVPTTRRESRAAGQIWALLKWRKDALIDNKVLPLKLQKVTLLFFYNLLTLVIVGSAMSCLGCSFV